MKGGEDEEKSNGAAQKKSNFRIKVKLSDGVSFITALMSEPTFNKMASFAEQWDIVRVNKFSRLNVKGQNILLLRDVVQILHKGLTGRIGDPDDISKNLAESEQTNFDL